MQYLAKLAVLTPLLAFSFAVPAAFVRVESFVITAAADNILFAPPCTTGTTAFSACNNLLANVGPGSNLGLANPLDTGPVQSTRVIVVQGNVSGSANFILSGQASASATLGSLHAAVSVQITGAGFPPGGNFTAPSIGGRGQAAVDDILRVKSATLPNGTPVTINTLFQVTGAGGGRLDLNITGFGTKNNEQFGHIGSLFNGGDAASDAGPLGIESLTSSRGSFNTYVGDILHVTYSLEAFTRQFAIGWRPIDVLNGRARDSFYLNSAHLFIEPSNPALDIALDNGTGFSYAFPAAVPLPASVGLLLPALGLLLRRRTITPS